MTWMGSDVWTSKHILTSRFYNLSLCCFLVPPPPKSPHHKLKSHKPTPVHWKWPDHCHSQTLEKGPDSFLLVLDLHTINWVLVLPCLKILGLNEGLDVINGVSVQPGPRPSETTAKKRNQHFLMGRKLFSRFILITLSPHKLINAKISGHGHGLPQQRRIKPQIQTPDAILFINLDSGIHWSLIPVILAFLHLH